MEPPLPPIYWQVFDELNEHNLLSFKSYSESFNGTALEEFYGHLTNYCKVKGVKRSQVNLYVLTTHYPKDLLEPLRQAGQVKTVRPNEVYDLTISTMKRIRFIICSQTDNPILALFSTDVDHIRAAYTTLQQEPELFDEVSTYWQQILTFIDEEIKNMYTKEDFLRDYPPTEDAPFLFGWQLEEFAQKNREQGQEKGHAAAQSMLEQLLVRRFGPISNALRAQLQTCTLDQLQALVNPALDAADLDAFVAQIPNGDEAGEQSVA